MPARTEPAALMLHRRRSSRSLRDAAARAVLLGLLFASVCTPGKARGADASPTPNIVLILADDQGYGDAGCYGATDIETPNIDRLAREGTRFTSFYVAQPVCTASRAALLSGCYSNRVGMAGALNHTSLVGMNPQETLVSELCRRQGYATAIYGKWHLGHQPPFLPTRQGFDEFFGIPYSNDNGPLHPVTRGIPPLPLYENETVVERDPDQSQFTRRLTERAVRFIEKNKARPFFLYLPHIMPHVPIFASDRFRGASRRGLYGDVIQELDWSVDQVLAALAKHGLDERTLVIYASDNGPFLSYGEHAGSAGPLREGKLTTFEGGVREPCLMRWPGKIPQGRICDEIVSSMDLAVTIAGLIGAEPPKVKLDGIDVAGLLFDRPGAKGRDTFWYYSGDELHAVRQGDWKLHLPHEYLTVAGEPGKGGKPSNFGRLKPQSIELSGIRGIASRHGYRVEKIGLSLYNLKDDPGETKNLAPERPEIVERLQLVAAAARDDLGDALTNTPSENVRPRGDLSTLPAPAEPGAEPAPGVSLIFDTDVGNDIDDALALGVIHALQSRGECRLLAVTINKDEPACAPFVDLVNTFYGRGAIPIGVVRGGKTPEPSRYTRLVVDARDGDAPDGGAARYPHDLAGGQDAPEAVRLLRETLHAQPDASVVIVAVGFSTNLASLLASPADERIAQTGLQLAANKCRLLSMMAGNFRPGDRRPEYNIKIDVPAARTVFARWPTPIVVSGFEIGEAILFPGRSIETDFGYAAHHPLADAYRAYHRMPYDRPTWDLTSALYAVRPDAGYFGLSEPGKIELDEKGVTSFRAATDGKHRYLTLTSPQAERTREALTLLVSQPPRR